LGKKLVTVSREYKTYKITTIEFSPEIELSYVRIKDLLIIGLGKKSVQLCVDAFTKRKISLAQDVDYLAVRKRLLNPAQIVGFVDTKMLMSEYRQYTALVCKALGRKALLCRRNNLSLGLKGLSYFRMSGFSSVLGNFPKSKSVIFLNKNRSSVSYAKVYSFKPQNNHTIDFVPRNIIGYYWMNYFDIRSAWKNLRRGLSGASRKSSHSLSSVSINSIMKTKLGVTFKDIIPVVGRQIGGFLSDVGLGGMFPMPKFLIFVKINDQNSAENIINSLIKKNNILMQSENYGSENIKYILLPFGSNIRPGYCFMNNFLLISSTDELIKESIDVYENKAGSLTTNDDFKAVDFGLTGKNNAVLFLNTGLLLDKIKGVSDWALGWISFIPLSISAYEDKLTGQLSDLKRNINSMVSDLATVKINLKMLENEIKNDRNQGLDVSSKQKKLAVLKAISEAKGRRIMFYRGKLEAKQRELNKKNKDVLAAKTYIPLISLYLKKVVYPILEGFKEMRAVGYRVVFNKKAVENLLFYRIQPHNYK